MWDTRSAGSTCSTVGPPVINEKSILESRSMDELIFVQRWNASDCPATACSLEIPAKDGSSPIMLQAFYCFGMPGAVIALTPQMSTAMNCYRRDLLGRSARSLILDTPLGKSDKMAAYIWRECIQHSEKFKQEDKCKQGSEMDDLQSVPYRYARSRGYLGRGSEKILLWGTRHIPLGLCGNTVVAMGCAISLEDMERIEVCHVLHAIDHALPRIVAETDDPMRKFLIEECKLYLNDDAVRTCGFFRKMPMVVKDVPSVPYTFDQVGGNAVPVVLENNGSSTRSRANSLPALEENISTEPIASDDSERKSLDDLFQQLLFYLTPGMLIMLGNFSGHTGLNGAIVKTADPPVLNTARTNQKEEHVRIHVEPLSANELAVAGWSQSRRPDVHYPRDVRIKKVLFIVREKDLRKVLDRQLNDPLGDIPRNILQDRFSYKRKKKAYDSYAARIKS